SPRLRVCCLTELQAAERSDERATGARESTCDGGAPDSMLIHGRTASPTLVVGARDRGGPPRHRPPRTQSLHIPPHAAGARQPPGLSRLVRHRRDLALEALLHHRGPQAGPGTDAARRQRETALLLRASHRDRPPLARP